MTRTRWTVVDRLSRTDPRSPDAFDEPSAATLLTALALGLLAAVLLALGSVVPVVTGAARGYLSPPLLIVLAVVPIALAGAFALRGRQVAAAGVLAGFAALAPGRAVLDLEFLADPSAASRPELYRPVEFALPGPGAGLWLLLAGHVVTVAAGVLAVRGIGPRADDAIGLRLDDGLGSRSEDAIGLQSQGGSGPWLEDASGLRPEDGAWARSDGVTGSWPEHAGVPRSQGAMEPRTDDAIGPGSAGRGLLPVGLVAAGLAAVGVMMAPFSGDDAFLPVGSAFERPPLVLAGCLLLAFALPVAAGMVISSGARGLGMGGLLGLGIAAATVALPELVSGLAVAGIGMSAGPIVVLAGALGLVIVAFLPGGRAEGTGETDAAGALNLPGSPRLRMTTGALGLVTMLAAIAGTFTDQVVVAGGLPGPESPSRWLLLVAGLLVGVLCAAMFVPGLAAAVRPALSVAWAGVPLAATAVLTIAITATELRAGLSPGQGVLWTSVAVATAVATACCSVVAGMVERDDGEDAGDTVPGPNMITPLVAGGILAIGGFGTPSIVAPDYVEPALWQNFGTPSWGLLLALLTVLGACFLAPRSRPARATALLAGATCLAALRVLALPLTGDRIHDAHAGVGWWLALGCVVALAIATVLAPRGPIHTRKTPAGSIR
ncbi:hypothetical protein [Amycolatopsis pithecellobii]|uniref:Uncharacterized protein n=1 Tax=Amycolatopsis pithecellobii TaxID=664692 RepID=A0A6N7YWJ5_9PSEU|nr:hypothetical protein [Amycolatopsis pithecellobii]MTD56302.1 hypothetical protein [Amycolatopsis pithecellobii]